MSYLHFLLILHLYYVRDDVTHARQGADDTSAEAAGNQEVATKLATDNEQLRLWYCDRSVTICSMNSKLELQISPLF